MTKIFAIPTKLRNGGWGAKATIDTSTHTIQPGTTITIRAKSGKTWTTEVREIVWTEDTKSKYKTMIFATSGTKTPPPSTSRRTSRRRGCITGGNCSSFGTGRSCGAPDCDGY